MKNIRNLLIIATVLLLSGCTKDFLNPKSLSTFDKTAVFSNVDDARKATNNCYVEFGQDAYRTRISITLQNLSDLEHGGDATSSKANYQINALHATADNGDLQKAWQGCYYAINDCNVVIDGISSNPSYNDPTTSADMHQFIGEAYTLRAFWYSILIYGWGDVPFPTKAPQAGMNFNLPKTNRDTILSHVIQDMIKCEPTMKWASDLPQSCQQVSRDFTIAEIARLSLQRGGYSLYPDMTVKRPADYLKYYKIARDYCLKLMTIHPHTLQTDFAQVFKNECQEIYPSTGDVIFEIPYGLTTGEVGYDVGMRLDAGPNNPYGRGSHDYSLTPTYYYSFDAKDKRKAATCGLYNLDKNLIPSVVGITDIGQKKWSKMYCDPPLGTASFKGTGINWPVMRYADVLLMYAEAENEINGPDPSAQDALKQVRRRAFDEADWPTKVDAYVDSVSASKETFFNAIVNERAWEFGGEMLRKDDLIRWGIYGKKMQECVDGIKKLGDEAVANSINAAHATYVYYRVDNKQIKIFFGDNGAVPPNYVASTSADADGTTLPLVNGWVRSDWTRSLKNGDTGEYNSIISNELSPYITSTPVRYIQPIPLIATENSGGVLTNDGYGF